jgi:hypothetical protein
MKFCKHNIKISNFEIQIPRKILFSYDYHTWFHDFLIPLFSQETVGKRPTKRPTEIILKTKQNYGHKSGHDPRINEDRTSIERIQINNKMICLSYSGKAMFNEHVE